MEEKLKSSAVLRPVEILLLLFVDAGDLLEGGGAIEKLEENTSVSLFVLVFELDGLVKNESYSKELKTFPN